MSDWRSGASTAAGVAVDDPTIPVLTDRIYLPELELDFALPGTPRPAPPPAARAPLPPADAEPPASDRAIDFDLEPPPQAAEAVDEAVAAPAQPSREEPAPRAETEGAAAEVIEAELDRDLIAAIDADFEAVLQAEEELEAAEHDAAAADRAQAPAAAEPAPSAPAPTEAPSGDAKEQSAEPSATTSESAEEAGDVIASGDVVEPESAIEAQPDEGTPAAEELDAARASARPGDIGDAPEAAADRLESAPGEKLPTAAIAAVIGRQIALDDTAAAELPEADAQALAAQADTLREAVLHGVAQRLPERIDAIVRDLMQPAIDQALARVGEEAQVALRMTMQDLVEQVLREELARRESPERPH